MVILQRMTDFFAVAVYIPNKTDFKKKEKTPQTTISGLYTVTVDTWNTNFKQSLGLSFVIVAYTIHT